MTPADLLRLEPEQLPDAVVLVDDVVAGAQVGERRRARAPRRLSARGAALAEDLVCRAAATRPSSRQTKPAPRRRDREQELRLARAGSSPASSSRASTRLQQVVLVRSASPRVRERDDDALAAADEAASSSFSASARPRAAIAGRCASNENGCACGKRVELGGALERDRLEPFLAPRRRVTSSGCQTKSGARSSDVHEVARNLRIVRLLVAVEERRLGEIGSALDGGVDHVRRRPGAARAG